MWRLQIGFDLFFTTESVKTPPTLFQLSWSFIDVLSGILTLVYQVAEMISRTMTFLLCLLHNLIFIWLIRHWACKFMSYTWLYRGHGWFWFLYDVILIIISSWLIDFIYFHHVLKTFDQNVWLCDKRMGNMWVWFHIEWQCLIILWHIDKIYGFGFTFINGTLI